MVLGTRIPRKTGEENNAALSGLQDLYTLAPWTHIDLGVHLQFIYKIGKPWSKCND